MNLKGKEKRETTFRYRIHLRCLTAKLERDKINTFWEISKRQLDTTKADLRNKDRELEEIEERHAVEIKVSVHRRHVNLLSGV